MPTQHRDTLRVCQINLHKLPRCNTEISDWTMALDNSIALCQEPGYHKGRVKNLNSNLKCFTGVNKNSETKPRACIILNSEKILALKLNQFCNADQTAISIHDPITNTKLVIASTYMPGDSVDSPPPQITQDLIEFCQSKNFNLLLGADANSHNLMWGSTNDNRRGEDLLEYIITTNLEIVNRGSTPTFVNAIRSEVLDITLASLQLIDRISNWAVADIDMLSGSQTDHSRS